MYCGIDVSKGKSNICIIGQNKQIIKEFQIEHTEQGFKILEQTLPKDIEIGLESTGNYCKTIYSFLEGKFKISYVDNLQMKNYARLHSMHIKNDKVDAKLIARFLTEDGINKITPVRMTQLKDLSRLYQKIVKQRSMMKIMLKDQLNYLFPEIEKYCFLREAKRLPQLLAKFPSAHLIAKASLEQIRDTLNEYSPINLLTLKYAKKIQDLAKHSVGIKDYPTGCFQYTVKVMLYLQSISNEIIEKMHDCLLNTPYHPLLKEFGYSDISLATIVGEVGDIRRFPSHKKFVSYCGFDISEHTSGKSLKKKSYITKNGNSILRFRFYMSVLVHIKNNTEYARFYQRLKATGKHPKKCLIATARKLAIKCYWDMMKCHD